jgi:two-component system LytT family sensor kinase
VADQARINEQDAVLMLESYKNRIRPHFLFNQLNNVNSFLNQEKLVEAQEYIGLLSEHLRFLLENSNDKLSTISQEIDRLKKYVELQQKATSDKIEIRFSIAEESLPIIIPTGLFQPLVENSFKYAGNTKFSEVYIQISVEARDNKVSIQIEDSGYGFMERSSGTGQGLKLIEDRIAFNKSISPRPELWTLSTNFGKRKSTVNITMPLT